MPAAGQARCQSAGQGIVPGHVLMHGLVTAQAAAEEKARELAVANGIVAEKTRQYAEVQRLATESEQQAAALEDKVRLQMLETKSER